MKQLLPCLLLEVPYGPLSDAILEMGIDAAIADVLPMGFTVVNERIIYIILLDLDVMPRRKFFECSLCLYFFFQ